MYALCVSHVKIYTYCMYINKHFPQIQIIFHVICWGPCKSQKIWNIANVRKYALILENEQGVVFLMNGSIQKNKNKNDMKNQTEPTML
jgi:hypothetical protein